MKNIKKRWKIYPKLKSATDVQTFTFLILAILFCFKIQTSSHYFTNESKLINKNVLWKVVAFRRETKRSDARDKLTKQDLTRRDMISTPPHSDSKLITNAHMEH